MSKGKLPRISALKGAEFDSIEELIGAVSKIAHDKNHPEHEKAQEFMSQLWNKTLGGLARSCGLTPLANPYAKKEKPRFVFR